MNKRNTRDMDYRAARRPWATAGAMLAGLLFAGTIRADAPAGIDTQPATPGAPATQPLPIPEASAAPATQPASEASATPATQPASEASAAPAAQPRPTPEASALPAVQPLRATPVLAATPAESAPAETATTESAPADKAAAPARPAEPGLVSKGLTGPNEVSVMVNRSVVLHTASPYKDVSDSQPDVASVTLVGPQDILLTAKKPGATQLIIWDERGRTQAIDVMVGFDLGNLRDQLKKAFPGLALEVSSANGAVVLRGRVPSVQVADQIVQIATPYGPNVLNLLEVAGGQQVELKVRFAEVARSATTNLGFNAFATDGHFRLGFNNGAGSSTPGSFAANGTGGPNVTVFGSAEFGNVALEAFIDALRQNSLLRMLAEPNLIAMSGQQADFLAGGEFPIPVPQAGGGATAITIEYKQFGVRLGFIPVVLGDGHIRLKVSPEVSNLDFTNSVSFNGFVIPSVTKRTVSTTIELAEGQTFAVAGLLNNQVNASSNVTPLLGDIPILGALFRSVRYTRSETELVVLVTPHLVGPVNPGQLPRFPGENWRHPTEVELFVNKDLGGPAADNRNGPTTRPAARYYGNYGFTPSPAPAK